MFDNAQLKKLILPFFVEQFLAMLVGVADALMISCAGEAAAFYAPYRRGIWKTFCVL